MANKLPFVRGDGNTHSFSIPAASWSPGGRLFFAAKPAFDDDNTDALAKIQGDWGDDAITDVTIKGVAYKKYTCYFPPAATNSVPSDGSASIEYLGEFQYVPATGIPVTMPPIGKLKAILYFDVKRKTTV